MCQPLLWASRPSESVLPSVRSAHGIHSITFPIVRADSPDSDCGPSPQPTADVGGAAPAAPGVDAQECAETLHVAAPPPLPQDGDNDALPVLDSASESDHDNLKKWCNNPTLDSGLKRAVHAVR